MPFFSKKPSQKSIRLFFATDLHGSERTFRKFVNAGKFYQAEVLVMGGDVTGKLLVPIIQENNGHYRATLQGRTEHLSTQEELAHLIEKLGTLGFYHKLMPEDEFNALQADHHAVEALFQQLARQKLENWVGLVETRLAGSGIKCYVTGGNDDDPQVLKALHQPDTKHFIACEGEVVFIDDAYPMISIGYSTPTPWNTPREISDESLGAMITDMAGKVPDLRSCIFNLHNPPIDSTLDTCPMLDWSTDPPTPIVKAGQVVMHGAGSQAVRRAIESHQPMLSLHGHIHEAQAVAKIGRTTCVNPGSEYGEGVLRGCLVTLANGEITSFQMTRG